jgi:Bacterial Ig-like domain (group 2)
VQVGAGATSATFNITTSAAPNTVNAIITATATGVVLTAQFTVQVVSVAVSPAELTIFTGHSQQFSATVTGTGTTDVTWSLQEAAGGSVNASGFFVGQAQGDYHIVARSVADPTKNGVGIAHVRDKGKDKEKEKEKDKEKERTKDIADKVDDKVILEKATAERLPQLTMASVVTPAPSVPEESSSPKGRAFIRPSERPDLTPPRRRGGRRPRQ